MAKKRKNELPSGNIRVQVYDYTDQNDKKHYRSFTAATKTEANAMAAEWKNSRNELKHAVTLYKACSDYITLRTNVLSPATITGYKTALRRIEKHRIANIDLRTITALDLQDFVSSISKNLTPKTVSNTYGLISSAIKMHLPNKSFSVMLPAKQKAKLYIPDSNDIQILLDACPTTELKLGILFAAIGTMRRGEACAVTFDDIDYDNQSITINKAYVKVDNAYWEIKSPKTYESNRTVRLPEFVFDMIRSLKRNNGYVLDLNPDQLYDRFTNTLSKTELPHFRYHDLRHYAASQLHASGMPERYIEAMGGWKPGSNVLKRVYENVLDSEMMRMQEEYLKKSTFNV